MKRSLAAVWVVLRKELSDALRDRRTLATVLVSSVLMGPLVLLAISGLVASLESRAEQREVYVAGLANAPTLRNFLERQTYVVKEAPADFTSAASKSAGTTTTGSLKVERRSRASKSAGASLTTYVWRSRKLRNVGALATPAT